MSYGCPDSPYKRILRQEGFPETRANDIAEALWTLFKAIAALDLRTMKLFASKTIEERLHEFAEAEDLRDIVADLEKVRK